MKNSFRQSMSWLHTWTGLVMGWVLYFMFVTGTAGYFDTEIDRWMQPELNVNNSVSQTKMLALAERRLNDVAANAEEWYVGFPTDREPFLVAWWLNAADPETGKKGKWESKYLDLISEKQMIARDTGGGRLLYRMHYNLHYIPPVLAYWLTSLCTMFMLISLITGIVIHKKIFRDFFTFRRGNNQRSWLDMHNVLSVLPIPFHFMITYSGLLLLMVVSMPGVIGATYGLGEENRQQFYDEAFAEHKHKNTQGIAVDNIVLSDVLVAAEMLWGEGQVAYISIENRAGVNAHVKAGRILYDGIGHNQELVYDAVNGKFKDKQAEDHETRTAIQFYEVMSHLHEGLFAGRVLRWLYFLSGVMGAGMIASGMVLWAVKRRERAEKKGSDSRNLRLVEAFNAGVIMGLPIGIAAYFWANRLLPVDMAGRADNEVLAMFVVMGLLLCYPSLRRLQVSMRCVWVELSWLAAAIYAFIPVLNMLTTDKHLINSVPQGDWLMAGFDLTVFLIGCVFAVVAIKVQRRKPADVQTAAFVGVAS